MTASAVSCAEGPPQPPRLHRNILANTLARLWTGLIQFATIPFYVGLLEPESYGLIAFYMMVLASLLFLDQAISPVLARELGRLGRDATEGGRLRDLLRSLEIVSLLVAVAIGVGLALLAPVVAAHWIKAPTLRVEEVETAVRWMAVSIAAQWPFLLYAGGFVGLQRQDLLTRLRMAMITLQWVGAAVLLWGMEPDVVLFLAWHAGIGALFSLLARRSLWRLMPAREHRAAFDWHRLAAVWRFGAGTLTISLLAVILSQSDKMIVSRYVPLDSFSSYNLSFTAALLLSAILAQPVSSVLLPHFSALIAGGDRRQLAEEYHRWTQIAAVAVLPTASVAAFFSQPLVELWLGSGSGLVAETAALLPWMIAGTAVNALMMVPLVMQMAFGWTRLGVIHNAVAAALLVPVLLIAVPAHGPVAGAWAWAAVNFSYYVVMMPVMHRRILKGELGAWWLKDTLLPALAAVGIVAASAALAPSDQPPGWALAQAATTAAVAAAMLVGLLRHPRTLVAQILRRARGD